jgi:hypothetical protein
MAKRNIDRGKILQEAVTRSGLSVKIVANRAGYQRVTYYSHIIKPDLSFEILEKYGRALNLDFKNEIPEMKEYFNERLPSRFDDSQTLEYWKQKYYDLLERYNVLLEKSK